MPTVTKTSGSEGCLYQWVWLTCFIIVNFKFPKSRNAEAKLEKEKQEHKTRVVRIEFGTTKKKYRNCFAKFHLQYETVF
jgi:hypothetical protein